MLPRGTVSCSLGVNPDMPCHPLFFMDIYILLAMALLDEGLLRKTRRERAISG